MWKWIKWRLFGPEITYSEPEEPKKLTVYEQVVEETGVKP